LMRTASRTDSPSAGMGTLVGMGPFDFGFRLQILDFELRDSDFKRGFVTVLNLQSKI